MAALLQVDDTTNGTPGRHRAPEYVQVGREVTTRLRLVRQFGASFWVLQQPHVSNANGVCCSAAGVIDVPNGRWLTLALSCALQGTMYAVRVGAGCQSHDDEDLEYCNAHYGQQHQHDAVARNSAAGRRHPAPDATEHHGRVQMTSVSTAGHTVNPLHSHRSLRHKRDHPPLPPQRGWHHTHTFHDPVPVVAGPELEVRAGPGLRLALVGD